jgi:hypothetical protein
MACNTNITVRLKFWNYKISGYRSNELLSVNMLHQQKLHSRSLTREQSFVSVYRVYYVNTDNILMWIYKV